MPTMSPVTRSNATSASRELRNVSKVRPKDVLAVTVLDRMLFPDAGIGRGCVQRGEVVSAERPQLQEAAA